MTTAFKNHGHDHGHCIEQALDWAAAKSTRRGVRLTPIRRRVFELVWQSHRPVGAYDILEILKGEKRNAQPPTVYRALDFLIELGLIHRIESLNAYIGCSDPQLAHPSQFLICRDCGIAAEISDKRIDGAIAALAEETGFVTGKRTLEVEGQCPNCRGGANHAR
ncbi:MAG: transcriptional repressor [Rhodospirillaceae bacterium]|nr:transcriptional repressor [Rhodospirillaceae bacterium]